MSHLICLRSMFYCRKLTSSFTRKIWTVGKLKSNSTFLRAEPLMDLSLYYEEIIPSHLTVSVLIWNNQTNILGAKSNNSYHFHIAEPYDEELSGIGLFLCNS